MSYSMEQKIVSQHAAPVGEAEAPVVNIGSAAVNDHHMEKIAMFLKGSSIRTLDDFMFSLDMDLFGSDNNPKYLDCMQSKDEDPGLKSCLDEYCARRIRDSGLMERAFNTVKMVDVIQEWTVPQMVEFASKLQCGVRRKDGKAFTEDAKTRTTLMYTLNRHLGRKNWWADAEAYLNNSCN